MRPKSGFNPLHKNRLKPPTRALTKNPLLEFAYETDMITKDEYEACLKGDMAVQKHNSGTVLMNVNAPHFALKTGQMTLIYMGRGTDTMVNRILGLDE